MAEVDSNAIVIRGQSGELRAGYQVAAKLATWTLYRDGPEWMLIAKATDKNAFRLERAHTLELRLAMRAKTWRFRNVIATLNGDQIRVRGEGNPEVI